MRTWNVVALNSLKVQIRKLVITTTLHLTLIVKTNRMPLPTKIKLSVIGQSQSSKPKSLAHSGKVYSLPAQNWANLTRLRVMWRDFQLNWSNNRTHTSSSCLTYMMIRMSTAGNRVRTIAFSSFGKQAYLGTKFTCRRCGWPCAPPFSQWLTPHWTTREGRSGTPISLTSASSTKQNASDTVASITRSRALLRSQTEISTYKNITGGTILSQACAPYSYRL